MTVTAEFDGNPMQVTHDLTGICATCSECPECPEDVTPYENCDSCCEADTTLYEECDSCCESCPDVTIEYIITAIIAALIAVSGTYGIKVYKGKYGPVVQHRHAGTRGYHDINISHRGKEKHPKGKLTPEYEKIDGEWVYVS